jgi:TIGR03009 family protein
MLVTALSATFATGFALAAAQEGRDREPANPQAPPAAARKAPVRPDPARMEALLELWAGQSAKLRSLEVSMYRIDRDLAFGDEEHFVGHAAFRAPALAYVDYRKVKMQAEADPKVKGKKVLVPAKNRAGAVVSIPFETILCTGTEVWDYRFDVKQAIVYTLDKDERKRALEEGPLPFLFNLRAQDAKNRYEMALQREDKQGYLVMVKPKLKDDAVVFSTAFILLDREFLLPTRIRLMAPDSKSYQDFTVSKINPNKEIPDRYFQGVKPGDGWRFERNPGARPASSAKGRRGMAKRAPPAAGKVPRAPAGDPPEQASTDRDEQRDEH